MARKQIVLIGNLEESLNSYGNDVEIFDSLKTVELEIKNGEFETENFEDDDEYKIYVLEIKSVHTVKRETRIVQVK